MALSKQEKPYDAIVVGTGFGGSVAAARLAQKGMRLLVLERGPWWGPLNRHRPAADRRELPHGLIGSRKLLRSIRRANKGRRREWLVKADGLQEIHIFEHLRVITGSGVGGGSHLYTNILESPPPEYFEHYPRELRKEVLHPYFERVRAMLRPSPIPRPPRKTRVFEAAVQAAGLPPIEYPGAGGGLGI